MKVNSYILIILLLCMSSCAGEGPFTMGKFDCNVEACFVTPTTTLIKVTMPDIKDNILSSQCPGSVILYEKPLSSSDDAWGESVIWLSYSSHSGSFWQDKYYHTYYYFTDKLTPDKTYYVSIGTKMYLHGDGQKDWWAYRPDFSFTTAKTGDYSNLGDVTCELVEAVGHLVRFRFALPPNFGLRGTPQVIAGTSSDMTDPIKSENVKYDYDTNTIEAVFVNMNPGTYYFKIEGDAEYRIGDQNIRLGDISINVSNSLTLSESDFQ